VTDGEPRQIPHSVRRLIPSWIRQVVPDWVPRTMPDWSPNLFAAGALFAVEALIVLALALISLGVAALALWIV